MAVGVETGQAGRGSWEMPGTVDAWCTFFPGGWELKDQSTKAYETDVSHNHC